MKILDVIAESYGAFGSKALGTGNFTTFVKHYQGKKYSQNFKINFGKDVVYEVPDSDVDKLADYYNNLTDDNAKREFIYGVMARDDKFLALCQKLGLQCKPVDGEQMSLLERESKKNANVADTGTVSDPRTAVALRKAYTKFPTAGSDIEAYMRQDIDQQADTAADLERSAEINRKQDKNLDRLTTVARKQNAQLSQVDAKNDQQEKEIDRLERELAAMGQSQPTPTPTPTPAEPKAAPSAAPQPRVSGSSVPVAAPVAAPAEPLKPDVAKLPNFTYTFKPAPALPKPKPAQIGHEPSPVLPQIPRSTSSDDIIDVPFSEIPRAEPARPTEKPAKQASLLELRALAGLAK